MLAASMHSMQGKKILLDLLYVAVVCGLWPVASGSVRGRGAEVRSWRDLPAECVQRDAGRAKNGRVRAGGMRRKARNGRRATPASCEKHAARKNRPSRAGELELQSAAARQAHLRTNTEQRSTRLAF